MTQHSLLKQILDAIWFILPAYVANGAPVIASHIVRHRHPMDFGLKFIDGRRVFGDSKSWEGFLFGIALGTVVASLQYLFCGKPLLILRGFVLSVGALLGDCVGAFIKRRLGIPPGKPAPLLDQLSFLVVAIAFTSALNLCTLTAYQLLILILLTPILHVLANTIAYLLGLKNVPW